MSKSNWEITKQRSKYHFNPTIMDPRWDAVHTLGTVIPNWQNELDTVIKNAKPVTWRTRGKPNDTLVRASEEYDQEEYDLESYGMNKTNGVTTIM